MSVEKSEPVFAVSGWTIIPICEHDAIVFKFSFTAPPHEHGAKQQVTPALSLPAEQITNLISVLQQNLEAIRNGDEKQSHPSSGLH